LISFVASHGNAFEVLEFAEEVFDEMAPFVEFGVDLEWFASPWMLGDDDFCAPLIHVFDDPVGIKGLVGDQTTEFDVFDQGCDTDGVKAMAGEQNEPHQIPKCVGQRKDFGGPAALRLADGLIFGPPLAPCAWR
jgi:hypothetical protein